MKIVKRMTVGVLAGALVFLGGIQPSNAAVVNTNDSNATINFIEGTGATEVFDPSDPTQPYTPTLPSDPTDPLTGNDGPLTLDFVSSINFGDHEIQGTTQVYQAETIRPFIQVTDRRGTGAGWNVTASVSNFVDESTNTTLPGAVLTLNNSSVVSTSTSAAPTPANEIILPTNDTEANVVTADADQGLGTWITRWFPTNGEAAELNDNITLEVPAGSATIGNHTATITWTLTDAP